jgi:hypothetical protein
LASLYNLSTIGKVTFTDIRYTRFIFATCQSGILGIAIISIIESSRIIRYWLAADIYAIYAELETLVVV